MSLRTVSRLIAAATAMLVLGAAHLAWRTTTGAAAGVDPFTVDVVTLRATPSPVKARAPHRVATAAMTAAPTTSKRASTSGDSVRLWWDGPAGEIVFRSMDRYQRCAAARMERREEPDCPGAGDARAMVLAHAG